MVGKFNYDLDQYKLRFKYYFNTMPDFFNSQQKASTLNNYACFAIASENSAYRTTICSWRQVRNTCFEYLLYFLINSPSQSFSFKPPPARWEWDPNILSGTPLVFILLSSRFTSEVIYLLVAWLHLLLFCMSRVRFYSLSLPNESFFSSTSVSKEQPS